MSAGDDRELTPAEQARVSALLREAGGPLSIPPDVAARLDGVLDDLVGDRDATPVAEVTALHRRRRRGRVLLVAAATVVAGGFAVPTLFDNETAVTRSTVQDEARESAPDDAAGDAAAGAAESPPVGAEGAEPSPPAALRTRPDREARLVPSLGPVVLASARLEEGVLAALRAGQQLDVVPDPDAAATGTLCPEPRLDEGETWSPAEYDGQPAVLVAAAEEDGTVEAVVRSCTGAELDDVVVELR